MKARWQAWLDKIDALNTRERALVLLSALAVVYLIWDVVIFNPLAVAKSEVDTQLRTTVQHISAMEQEEAALLNAVNADPDRDLKEQLQQLQQTMESLDGKLSELSLALVPVDKLTAILEDVLKQTGALRLESLKTLPVEELKLSTKAGAGDGEDPSAGVYKHSAELIVRGSFFDLVAYLQALEAMDWRFYWEALYFNQVNYPNAVITLKVYTLTTDEGLFGV